MADDIKTIKLPDGNVIIKPTNVPAGNVGGGGRVVSQEEAAKILAQHGIDPKNANLTGAPAADSFRKN